MTRVAVLAALLLAGLTHHDAWAQDADAAARAEMHLEACRSLYRELDFAGAVDSAERAIGTSGISQVQRLEAYEYLGSSLVVLNREEEARPAFRAMFAIDPYHRVSEPSGSPKIARFVEEVRGEFVTDAALGAGVRAHLELPESARARQDVPVRVRTECESGECPQVAGVVVRFRSDDVPDWSDTDLDPEEDAFVGSVPAPDSVGRLLVYAVARDGAGRMLARAGEPLSPIVLVVREAAVEPPRRRRTGLWIALAGIAAAGLATGLALGLRSPTRAPNGSLPPGRVELP